MKRFPSLRQLDDMDCGPTCLRMIARHHGKIFDADFLREKCSITRAGVSLAGISEAAEAIGMNSLAVQVSFETLRDELPLRCIAHWRQRHFRRRPCIFRRQRACGLRASPLPTAGSRKGGEQTRMPRVK